MTWSAVFFPLCLGGISGVLFVFALRFNKQARLTLEAADRIHAAAMSEFAKWQTLRMELDRCSSTSIVGVSPIRCYLPTGHDGPHKQSGQEWD